MTAKDRLEESRYCAESPCLRKVLPPHIYCDEHRDDASTPMSTIRRQMLEDLKKAWPKKEATDDYDNYNGGYLNGHISGYNKALAEAWAVVEGYFGGEK